MNNRYVIVLIMSALLITMVIGLKWFSSGGDESILTIYLRFDANISGILSVNPILSSGEREETEHFDLEAYCRSGKIELKEYSNEHTLQWVFKPENGERVKLNSKYGRDIQRDQDGFYLVLKITKIPPFIANDRI
ncbi:MAG: hypothetical protein SVR94_12280 [Pseudomonadota bacterium]|nr:hypothetical protein [Pseudomonadota bacterium]